MADLVQYTRTSLLIREGLSFEEWQGEGRTLLQMHRSIHWWIGDWLRYGERVYGETYAQAADLTGYDVHTLQNDVWVADRVAPSRRREDLSFSVHAEVAALEPSEQDRILSQAQQETLGVRDVRAIVKGGALPSAPKLDLAWVIAEVRELKQRIERLENVRS